MSQDKALYNEDITRRTFIGGAATAVAGAATLGSAALAQGDRKALEDPNVVTEKATFRSGADSIEGFLARPKAAGRYAGVLVIPGIFGVSDYMRETAAQLAQNGFVALDVNLFSRTPEAARLTDIAQLRPIVEKMPDAQILQDIQAGIESLKRHESVRAGGVGVVGFCMGGKYALLIAAKSPDVAAAVPFYGPLVQAQASPNRPAAPIDVVRQIRGPVQGHYASNDQGIPVDDVTRFQRALRDRKIAVEMFVYQGAGHAFHDYSRPAYKAEAAKLAWTRTLEFLKQNLPAQ